MTARFARFAAVGAIGLVLQLAALALFTAMGWPYVMAAAIAVELAALHNFYWHQRWTWCDRALPQRTVGRRLVDYHLTTASIAVAGNVVLTGAIVEFFGARPLLANVAAVAVLAAANFGVADRWVFVLPEGHSPLGLPHTLSRALTRSAVHLCERGPANHSRSGWTRMPAAFKPSRSRPPRAPAPGVSL